MTGVASIRPRVRHEIGGESSRSRSPLGCEVQVETEDLSRDVLHLFRSDILVDGKFEDVAAQKPRLTALRCESISFVPEFHDPDASAEQRFCGCLLVGYEQREEQRYHTWL